MQRTPSQRGTWSKTKGAAFERKVAQMLQCLYPGAKRGIGQARSASEVADVDGTPWWIETKAQHRVSIRAAVEQARAATDGRPILVITKDDPDVHGEKAEVLVTLNFDVFIKLLCDAVNNDFDG